METKKFKNSPLVETVCEFRFKTSEGFDPTIPGILYDRVKEKFPIKRQKKLNPISDLNIDNNGFNTTLSQFYSSDESLLIQVGYNILSINCLKNYPHWEAYKPLILDVLMEYVKIVNPVSITRVGLRAINKISIEETNFNIEDYFQFYPKVKLDLSSFQMRVESKFQNERDVLIMNNYTIVPEKPTSSTFVLDLDYVMIQPEKISFEEVEDWLEIAHSALYQSFIYSITENLAKQFE